MPDVTVAGAKGETVRLSLSSLEQASLSQTLAASITNGIGSGAMTARDALPDTAPPNPLASVGSGQSGEVVIHDSGVYLVGSSDKAVVSDATGAVIMVGDGADNQSVIAAGNLTYITGGGSGTIVSGAGSNNIITNSPDGVGWLVQTGAGDDTISSLTGNDTIGAGGGHNLVLLGSGSNFVDVSGADSIYAGSGSATVAVRADNGAFVSGGAGALMFIDGAGSSTVLGGAGAETIFGGAGSAFYRAGAGAASIWAGGGADTLVAGTGNATLSGGDGANIFEFVDGAGGGNAFVIDFAMTDTIKLAGFGASEAQHALDTAVVSGAGTVLKLSDGTTITLANVTDKGSIHFG